MRNISFALTKQQFLDRTKTVTRRLGWKNLEVGTLLCEGNPDYVELGIKRLETPWVPVAERRAKKTSGKRRKRVKEQRELFT